MLKKLTIGAAVLVGLVALALVAIVLFVDADRFKPQIERWVEDRYGRTLKIDGALRLSVFPRIALDLPRTTLSTRDRQAVAAGVESARVGVALWPLLRGQVQADRLRIEGLQATIERRRDGTTNIDDLIGRGAGAERPAGGPAQGTIPAFEVGGAEIVGARVTFVDLMADSTYVVEGFDLVTGPLAPAVRTPVDLSARYSATRPKAAGELKAKGTLELDLAQGTFGVRAFSATTDARVGTDSYAVRLEAGELRIGTVLAAQKLAATLRLGGALAGDARIDIDELAGDGKAVRTDGLRVNANFAQGARKIVVELASPLEAGIEARTVRLPKLAGEVSIDDPALPVRNVKLPLSGSVAVDAGRQTVAAALRSRFDESSIDAKVDVAGFTRPRIGFDAEVDRLDADRYLPKAPAGGTAPAPGKAGGTAAGGTAPDTRVDLAFLKDLDLDGRARIGELKALGIRTSDVRVAMKAAGGRLDVAPLSARLYGGKVDAKLGAQAAGNRVRLDATLAGVALAPLLKDAADTDLLEGRGDVRLGVTAAGASVAAMKRSLDGTGALRLADGAIRGIDLGAKVREAKRLLSAGGSDSQASDARQKTDFSEITASFVVKNGVASSNDLDGKSPLLRLRGAGKADIGAGRLDYLLQVSVVESSRGQGGRELEELRGITIPVHLTGPFEQPSWKIDWAAVARQALKSRAGEALQKQLAPQTERLKDERDKLRDQLKGGVRGLLNR